MAPGGRARASSTSRVPPSRPLPQPLGAAPASGRAPSTSWWSPPTPAPAGARPAGHPFGPDLPEILSASTRPTTHSRPASSGTGSGSSAPTSPPRRVLRGRHERAAAWFDNGCARSGRRRCATRHRAPGPRELAGGGSGLTTCGITTDDQRLGGLPLTRRRAWSTRNCQYLYSFSHEAPGTTSAPTTTTTSRARGQRGVPYLRLHVSTSPSRASGRATPSTAARCWPTRTSASANGTSDALACSPTPPVSVT